MCTVYMQEPPRPEDSVRSSETGVMGVMTSNRGAGNGTQGLLKDQEVLWRSQQPLHHLFKWELPPGRPPGRSCFEIPYSQLHTEVNVSDNHP